MTILALEFSSDQRSVAVWQAGAVASALDARQILSEVIEAGGGNTMKPVAMIAAALAEAGVEREAVACLAVGLGPGSYTGIRAAIALAQGWQLARGVRLAGVSSAEAIAAEAEAAGLRGPVAVVIDAQRGEFYRAAWEIGEDGRREIEPLRLVSRDDVQRHAGQGGVVVGPQVTKWFPAGRLIFPRAATIGRLAAARADAPPDGELTPIYLREVSFVKAPPARVLPV